MKKVLLSLGIAIIIGGSIYVAVLIVTSWHQIEPTTTTPETPSYTQGALYKAEESLVIQEGAKAVPALLQYSQSAKTAEDIAVTNVHLGAAYLLATTTARQGIELLKSLSLDQSAPAFYRVSAIEQVVVYGLNATDAQLSQSEIFAGPIWAGFLSGGDVPKAYLAALTWSDSLFPTIRVEYRIAWFLANELPQITDPAARQQKADDAMAEIRRADQLYAAVLAATPPESLQDQNFTFGVSLTLEARTLATLDIEHLYPGQPQDIEAVFRRAIALLEAPGNPTPDFANALYTRYYLAIYIASYGTPQEQSTLPGVLAPIYAASTDPALENAALFGYLRQFGTAPQQRAPTVRLVRQLAKLEPPFKKFLISLGWQNW